MVSFTTPISLGENVFLDVTSKDVDKIAKMMQYQGNCRGFSNDGVLHIFDSYGFTHTSFSSRMRMDTSELDSMIFNSDGIIILADQFGGKEYKAEEFFNRSQYRTIRKIYEKLSVLPENITVSEAP
jgi:hypothetical protein